MPLRNEIDECLKIIRSLEDSFQTAKMESSFTLSFFQDNNTRIYQLKKAINHLEEAKFQQEERQRQMEDELNQNEDYLPEACRIEEIKTTNISDKKEEAPSASVELLADKIGKKLYADIQSSLSLNDRFRFQKDLFYGDNQLMTKTLDYLNNLNSFEEVEKYLNDLFDWDWQDDSAIAFREILEKRFF